MTELTYKRLPPEDATDLTGEANQSRWYPLYVQPQTLYTDVDPDSFDLRRRCQEPLPPLPASFGGLYLSGWRIGVAIGAITATFALLVNNIVTVYVTQTFKMDEPGLYTLIGESPTACATSKKYSMWLHLVINVLSTLLLGASNYCMQCLNAPTRLEVDAAHRKGTWLDIGVPSMSNLRTISRQKMIVWLLIAFSSLPLHLLFNSVILENLSSNECYVLVVSNDFLLGGSWNLDTNTDAYPPDIQYLQDHVNDNKTFERLNKAGCINSYTPEYLSGRRNLLAVASGSSGNDAPLNSSLLIVRPIVTGPSAYFLNITYSSSALLVDDYLVDYCLSEIVPERCKLQFSLDIMIVVIICNAMKILCFVYTLWKQKDDSLTTIGDAIMSFLDKQDPTTVGLCRRRESIFKKVPPPEPWQPHRKRYALAASSIRWFLCIVFFCTTVVVTASLLGVGLQYLQSSDKPTDLSSLWKMGFGVVNSYTLIFASSHTQSTPANLIGFVLLSNSPQIILSALYLTYNGIYTSMQMADEWNRFSYERKPLRVTAPKQEHIPCKGGFYDQDGNEDQTASVLTCGYSCIAIIFTLCVGGLMILTVLIMGCRKMRPGIPVAGYCSAAISGACHPPADDVYASVLPVMWGVVEEDENGLALCTFTSKDVHSPEAGQFCTGMVDYSLDARRAGFPKSRQSYGIT